MQTANIGHNQPPTDAEILLEKLKEKNAVLFDQADGLLLEVEALPESIDSEEEATFLTDFIGSINEVAKKIEAIRVIEKKPYLEGTRIVDNFFNEKHSDLNIAAAHSKKPLTAYLTKKANAEREFREAEALRLRTIAEEEQKKADALAANDLDEQAKTSEKQATKNVKAAVALEQSIETGKGLAASSGYSGTKGVLQKRWVGEIEDIKKIDLNKLSAFFSVEDIQKAINSFVKANGRDLDGVKIYQKETVTIR